MARRCTIVGGPSKYDLMLALFDGDAFNRRKVTFQLDDRQIGATVDFFINEAAREDSSGESWAFKGAGKVAGMSLYAHGCFSTQIRSGWIEF